MFKKSTSCFHNHVLRSEINVTHFKTLLRISGHIFLDPSGVYVNFDLYVPLDSPLGLSFCGHSSLLGLLLLSSLLSSSLWTSFSKFDPKCRVTE